VIKIENNGNSKTVDFIYEIQKELDGIEFPKKKVKKEFIHRFLNILSEYEAEPEKVSWDLACFRGKQILYHEYNIEKLKFWDDFWQKRTKSRLMGFKQIYSPPNSYNPLLRIEKASIDLFTLYNTFKEKFTKFDENLFLYSFYRYRNSQTPIITQLEKEILSTALKLQTRDNTKISKKIGKSIGLVSRYINTLRDHDLIYIGTSINLHAIGLNSYAIYLKTNNMPIERILPDSRWIYKTYKSFIKYDTFLRYYVIPANNDGMHAIKSMRERLRNLKKQGAILKFHILERSEEVIVNFNLEYYDCNRKGWNIPLLTYYPLLISRWNMDHEIPDHVIWRKHSFTKLKKITKLDLDILNTYYKYGQISNSQLREILNVKTSRITNSIKKLRTSGAISERIQLNPMFNPEGLLLFTQIKNDDFKRIISTFSILPEFYLERYRTDVNSIIAVIRHPIGQTAEVALALEKIFEDMEHEIFILPELYGISWNIPIDQWSESEQKWKIDIKEILGEI